MKRLLAAAIILTAIVTIAFSEKCIIANCEKTVISKTENISKSPTEENTKDFKDYWDKKSLVLSIFINREAIEEIGEKTAEMYSASKNHDETEVKKKTEEIKYIIKNVAEDECFSLQSFF